jgi:hypothetical protein
MGGVKSHKAFYQYPSRVTSHSQVKFWPSSSQGAMLLRKANANALGKAHVNRPDLAILADDLCFNSGINLGNGGALSSLSSSRNAKVQLRGGLTGLRSSRIPGEGTI